MSTALSTNQSILAILFATAEPYTLAQLAKILAISEENVAEGIHQLQQSLGDSSLQLQVMGVTVTLTTKAAYSPLIEQLRKEELQKDLSRASAETLAVIAYAPGITKADIEFIRGVNVSYTLRSLQIRGLIEAKTSGRSSMYYPTLELLQSFGISTIEELPNYEATKAKIAKLLRLSGESKDTTV